MTYLIGDIGNTETKFCLLDKKFKIIKRINVNTLKIKKKYYFKKKIFLFFLADLYISLINSSL